RRIVNVASAIVAKGTPLLVHYVASKGAVIAMRRVLARELGAHGIALNPRAPGLSMRATPRATAALTRFPAHPVLESHAFTRAAARRVGFGRSRACPCRRGRRVYLWPAPPVGRGLRPPPIRRSIDISGVGVMP